MHHTMQAQDSELRRNYEFPTGIRGIGMIESMAKRRMRTTRSGA
jgi:hypothetical protein